MPKKSTLCESCSKPFQWYGSRLRRFCSLQCVGRGNERPWTMEELLEASIPEPMSGCWLWLRSTDDDGYGYTSLNRKTVKAHRVAYWLANGVWPAEKVVMHRCDTPSCVNPDHLRIGSNADNMRDRDQKGRTCRGDRHSMKRPELRAHFSRRFTGTKNPSAKLTEDQVRAIRSEYAATGVQRPLCAKYGITPMTVNAIVHGRSWTHVK